MGLLRTKFVTAIRHNRLLTDVEAASLLMQRSSALRSVRSRVVGQRVGTGRGTTSLLATDLFGGGIFTAGV